MCRFRIILIAAGLILPVGLSAVEPLRLAEDQPFVSLADNAEVLIDTSRSLSVTQASAGAYLPFAAFGDKALSHTSVWVRFRVQNDSAVNPDWILLVSTDLADRIEVYTGARRMGTGRFVPFWERPVVYRHFAVPLVLPPRTAETLYVRFDSDASIFLPMQLWKKSAFQARDRHEQLLFGMYFGLTIAMLLYNLFLSVSLRSVSYLYYVGYVLCFGLYQTTLNGISLEFFWPTHPVWNTRFSFLSANASLIMSLLFTRRFLNLSIIAQPLNRAMIALVTVAGAAAVASQILDHRGADIVSRSVGALVAVTVSIAALLAWVRGYAPARFFFAAWFLFILAALLFTLMGLGFLPRNDFTRYSMQIGSAVEMVLLSLALSDRITILRRQRDSAEAVARSMEREMETARSIQNAILPGSLPATPRATFAARYKPAASVGGDFYDFHQISKDKIGILIADVTGHGVPAALVASMLKVSFAHQRSIISDPGRVLRTMNTELAVRFGRHFITAGCLWLDLGWGSRAVYASAGHLPVCVRRRRKNRTEEIISYGKLLGWPDQFSVKPTQTKIESGDRVLMYTDGLIEARNNDGQLFGFARLYETLALADALPVEEAADAVLRAVYDWVGSEDELEDDMTLVMVDIT